jgi:hypothetical protein
MRSMLRPLSVTLSLVTVFAIPAAAVAQHLPQTHIPNPGGVRTGLPPAPIVHQGTPSDPAPFRCCFPLPPKDPPDPRPIPIRVKPQ